jgi:hypothetical protein
MSVWRENCKWIPENLTLTSFGNYIERAKSLACFSTMPQDASVTNPKRRLTGSSFGLGLTVVLSQGATLSRYSGNSKRWGVGNSLKVGMAGLRDLSGAQGGRV